MKEIKVLGTGCTKCKNTVNVIEQVAADNKLDVVVEKIEDPAQIMAYGVMSTPAVVVDEVVVHKGSVPSVAEVMAFISF